MKLRMISLFLVLSLLLCACGAPVQNDGEPLQEADHRVQSSPTAAADTPAPTETSPANTEAPPADTDAPVPPVTVEDAFFREGEYRDDVGNSSQYFYRIPAFSGDSEDVRRLNAAMYDDVMAALQSDLNCIDGEHSYSLFCLRADYEVYQNGDLLSVVESVHNDWGQTIYLVMNLDVRTQREVDRAALLALAGLDEESFLVRAREAAGNAFGDPGRYSEDQRSIVETQYEKTVSDDNFGPGLPLFIDGEGRLCMITPIYSLAGADYYYHIVPIE